MPKPSPTTVSLVFPFEQVGTATKKASKYDDSFGIYVRGF
jgi:hypothetical protein